VVKADISVQAVTLKIWQLRGEAANVGSYSLMLILTVVWTMIEQVDQAPQTLLQYLGAVLVVVLAWLVFLILRLVLPMPNLAYLKQAWGYSCANCTICGKRIG
jgi:hypothetical protein